MRKCVFVWLYVCCNGSTWFFGTEVMEGWQRCTYKHCTSTGTEKKLKIIFIKNIHRVLLCIMIFISDFFMDVVAQCYDTTFLYLTKYSYLLIHDTKQYPMGTKKQFLFYSSKYEEPPLKPIWHHNCMAVHTFL